MPSTSSWPTQRHPIDVSNRFASGEGVAGTCAIFYSVVTFFLCYLEFYGGLWHFVVFVTRSYQQKINLHTTEKTGGSQYKEYVCHPPQAATFAAGTSWILTRVASCVVGRRPTCHPFIAVALRTCLSCKLSYHLSAVLCWGEMSCLVGCSRAHAMHVND